MPGQAATPVCLSLTTTPSLRHRAELKLLSHHFPSLYYNIKLAASYQPYFPLSPPSKPRPLLNLQPAEPHCATSSSSPYPAMSPFLLFLVLLAGAPSAKTDPAKDRSDCANTLAGLATCLAYVQGSTAEPSPDCCTGLKGVLANSPKCLCVLIRDRDDPQLGLHIDLNRALKLPESCSAAANISRCPELLNLPPNSPSAQIFKNMTAGNTAKEGSAKDKGSSSSSSSSSAHDISRGTRMYNYLFEGEKQWRVTKLSFSTLLLTIAFMAG